MRRLLLRAGFLLLIGGGAVIGSIFPSFDAPVLSAASVSVAPGAAWRGGAPVLATPVSSSTPAISATPVPTATAAPTDSPTAMATDTALASPTPTTTDVATNTATVGTSTVTATSTPVATATPVPIDVGSLPALAPVPEDLGRVDGAVIDASGGSVSAADGRVEIVVPPAVLSDALNIQITKLDEHAQIRPPSTLTFVGAWQFDAFDVNAGNTPVHTFPGALTIVLHFTAADLSGLMPQSLTIWTFDQASQQWLPVPSQLDFPDLLLTAPVDHFTDFAATSTNLVNSAPMLDGRNVDLHSGSATLSVPIEIPSGVGGLTPDLTLGYDSGRIGDMHNFDQGTSWAGIGWDLDVPHIEVSYPPNSSPRVFLSLGNSGGEIMPGGQDQAGFIWRARNEQYLRIRTSCTTFNCPWVVTDQKGTQYVFGSDVSASATSPSYGRWYYDQTSPYTRRYYRFDLAYETDALYVPNVSGNRIDYSYWYQLIGDHARWNWSPQPQYVTAGYVSQITYNGGAAQITFNGGDFLNSSPDHQIYDVCRNEAAWQPHYGCVRNDTPISPIRDCLYFAPLVAETRRLTDIEVYADSQLARKYVLSYNTDALGNNFLLGGQTPCLPVQNEGTNRLNTLYLFGDDAANPGAFPLQTMNFAYTLLQTQYHDPITPSYYTWPYLSSATNGFGGIDDFTYTQYGNGVTNAFSRQAVTEERQVARAGQPDMVVDYAYQNGPTQWNYPNPYTQANEPFNSEYRGFGIVTEKPLDPSGNPVSQIRHSYYANMSGDWFSEVATGREYDTLKLDASGTTDLEEASTTWGVTPLSNPRSGGGDFVNFVYPSQVVTTSGRGSTTMTTYRVNSFDISNGTGMDTGQVTEVDDYAGSPTGTKELSTVTHYLHNASAWIAVPQDQQKLDAGGALLALTRFYYDGANTSAPTTPPPTGLLTAQATQTCGPAPATYACPGNPTGTSWNVTYDVYDSNGRQVQASVPTSVAPESQSPGSARGWIPATNPPTASSSSGYDSPTHALPTSATNALNQQTQSQYDWRLQKPTQVTKPNGQVVSYVYDQFGRIKQVFDNYDPANPGTPLPAPTTQVETFSYTWGSAPNLTRTEQYIDAVNTHVNESCLDGFGREIEHMESVSGSALNDVRTDYDAQGNKAVVTNAFLYDQSRAGCGPPPAVSSYNRTAYTSDALGNVTTTSLDANATSGPTKVVVHNGSTVTSSDELFHTTLSTSDPVARTLAVSPTTTVLRPTGSGQQDWAHATPAQAHYLNVREPLADDDGSQFDDQVFNAKDTQLYAGAGVSPTATVRSVTLHFRWKQYDVYTPNPAGPNMWAIFRQTGVDTRGPTYQSTNAAGWRDDTWVMTTNPRTGQSWTIADVNGGLEFGFEIYPTWGVWNYITQTSLEISTDTTALNPTVYSYDPLGRLTRVTDAAGNQTQLAYDMAGRKMSMTDPDMRTWTYAYDTAGRLTTQSDANSTPIVITLAYDALGRLKNKSYSNGDPPVSWTYDTYPDSGWCSPAATAAGLQTQMMDGPGYQRFCYDVRGRVAKTQRSVDALPPYEVRTSYDLLNQPRKITYPDGDEAVYGVDGTGNINSLTSDVDGANNPTYGAQQLMSDAARKPWGAIESLALGNGLMTSYSYDPRERLTNISTGLGGLFFQNFTLTYDDASNVTSTIDNAVSPTETAAYAYDELNRLRTMTIGGSQVAAYTYDQIGNLRTKQEGANDPGLTLCYPTNGVRPHAVSNIYATAGADCTVGSPARTFNYQADGSMLGGGDHPDGQDPTYTQRGGHAFDAENRVTEVLESRAGSAPSNANGIACVALRDPANGVLSATDAQLISVGFSTAPKIGYPGYDEEMDLHQQGALGASDAQLEFAWFQTGHPCPKQVQRYRYDGNGALLERFVPGGLQPAAVWNPATDVTTGWYATSSPHSGVLSDGSDDTYIQGSTGSTLDTFKLATQSVPAGAVIEYVKLNFRWEASGTVNATLMPVYKQGGTTAFGQESSTAPPVPPATSAWRDDKWVLAHNPVTGHYWTADDVNSAMEFGFSTSPNPASGNTPRVSKASVQVAYRLASSSSTIYIGGIFEENRTAGGTIFDNSVKYYNAFGRTIAMRTTDWGYPLTGTLRFPLHDHLGSTVDLLDENGLEVQGAKTTYWPYGKVRSGPTPPTAETDKQFTGQQREDVDTALGLYNYKARFYSTTLGRFVSADPMTKDGLNRYTYVGNNPASLTDPTGLCSRGLRRLAGATFNCTEGVAKALLSCAFADGACHGDSENALKWRNFARWVIGDVGFSDSIRDLITIRSGFADDVKGIRYRPEGEDQSVQFGVSFFNWHIDDDPPSIVGEHGSAWANATVKIVSFSYLDVEFDIDAQLMSYSGDYPGYYANLAIGDLSIRYRGPIRGLFIDFCPTGGAHCGASPLFTGGSLDFTFSLQPNRSNLESPTCGDLPLLHYSCGYTHHDWDGQISFNDRFGPSSPFLDGW